MSISLQVLGVGLIIQAKTFSACRSNIKISTIEMQIDNKPPILISQVFFTYIMSHHVFYSESKFREQLLLSLVILVQMRNRPSAVSMGMLGIVSWYLYIFIRQAGSLYAL